MAGKRSELGDAGEAVRATVRERREALNLSFAELERRTAAAGRRIPELGLRRIEKGERQVSVDELLVLADVLAIAPMVLLYGDDATAVDAMFRDLLGISHGWAEARDDEPATALRVVQYIVHARNAVHRLLARESADEVELVPAQDVLSPAQIEALSDVGLIRPDLLVPRDVVARLKALS